MRLGTGASPAPAAAKASSDRACVPSSSVAFSLLSLEEQRAAGMTAAVVSVQLRSRHWVITDSAGRVDEVRGAGVIGEYPRLLPGAPAVCYQSQTPLPRTAAGRGGSMRGGFSFVPGTLSAPTGGEFEAGCGPFPLQVPEYVY